jgi:hypothetical protein
MLMRRVVLLLAAVGAMFAGVTGSAQAASSVTLCVPSTEGAAITTPTGGSCGSGTSVQLPSEAKEQEKLISILPHINYEASGIDKQPTVQFSGINLQVINGSGAESTLNGTGNLILGYDETPGTQTGSHNLLLGGTGDSYTSYGGIGGGFNNKISGGYASVLGGGANTASGYASTITGGYANRTTTNYSTVTGGCSNLAGTGTLTTSSNCITANTGSYASILGGTGNQASAENSTISGGDGYLAGGAFASSVSGGKENKATGEEASVSGGAGGEASAPLTSIVGGRLGKAPYRASTVLGGLGNVTEKELGVTP